ncbi:transcriptional regulator [Pseudomonas aeruginosa]|uniref:alginate biosynthesis regulator MucC n=1 Tax=Pseudomonas aeruginosa TaxID=287 RepID=UPI000F528A40|nr:alginate biosynthesis regulator MucC [Pseudomonas aeruginosa]MCO1751567.1 transcriptional regulator [Pseudomonas aeruginosa]RPQ81789.1 transcriptional regulator [Pseudomonas aeruginosa]RPX97181.1 transcriptional regulator [Pseudomonas aeruginosa]
MIEEQGRVVATEPGAVWVETVRRSTCSSCSANAGCGQGMMQRLGVGAGRARVRALSDLSLRVGDAVVLGIHEDLLLRASVLFYLFPLLGFFVAALLATRAGLVEPLIIVSGLAGLLAAWLLVRRHARRHADDPASQPVVLRALISGPSDSA